MHRRIGGVQDDRPGRETCLNNSQLFRISEVEPRRRTDPHPANRRLSLGVNTDKEGRL